MKLNVKEYRNEDVVLMLPPEKPTIKELGHFQVKIVVMKTMQDILLKQVKPGFTTYQPQPNNSRALSKMKKKQ